MLHQWRGTRLKSSTREWPIGPMEKSGLTSKTSIAPTTPRISAWRAQSYEQCWPGSETTFGTCRNTNQRSSGSSGVSHGSQCVIDPISPTTDQRTGGGQRLQPVFCIVCEASIALCHSSPIFLYLSRLGNTAIAKSCDDDLFCIRLALDHKGFLLQSKVDGLVMRTE